MKNPGYPKFNLKKAKKLAKQYKDAHGGDFSVVLEHTNDPANSAEAQLIKEQLAKAGIDATLKQDDQTAFIITAVTGNFSIMLWRNHPGDDPDVQYVWWNTGSLRELRQDRRPGLQALLDQGRSEPDPAKRKADLPAGQQGVLEAGLQRVGLQRRLDASRHRRRCRASQGPPLPDGGGKPEFLFGRHPLLGIYLTQ